MKTQLSDWYGARISFKKRLDDVVNRLGGGEMKNDFSIIISKYRVYQGIALCRSLLRNLKDKNGLLIFILCMDSESYTVLKKIGLEHVMLIKLEDIESHQLRLIKRDKMLNEYCWTLKPVFLEYLLNKYNNIQRITQLDADLYFFNDPSPIFENQYNFSILLSDHNFPDKVKQKNERAAGKTNSAIVSFKRDTQGLSCITWWKARCFEWCYDRVEGNKFSDQRYLDRASGLFNSVAYISTPGVNIAPWNEMKYQVTLRENEVYVGDHKLILYHFCGLRFRNKNEYSLILESKEPIPIIYDPYIQEIQEIIGEVERIDPGFRGFQIEERFKDVEKIHTMGNPNKKKWEDKYCFATIASNKYLYKSIVMYRSLLKHTKNFHLFMLCVDEEAYKILTDLKLEWVSCIPLKEVEDDALLKAKNTRSNLEYCWTLKPAFLHYIMEKHRQFKYYALVDADLYFFDRPKKIFKETTNAIFYLTDHNNSHGFKHLYNKTGTINSGFVGCKNSEIALRAVEWWKNKCIEWCFVNYDEEAGLYADQRHLERWATEFSNVHIVQSIGANVAPWNITGYRVSQRDGKTYVNDECVNFYHFSGFSIFNAKEYNLTWFNRLDKQVVDYIYRPYIKEIAQVIGEIKERYPNFSGGFVPKWEHPAHYLKIK